MISLFYNWYFYNIGWQRYKKKRMIQEKIKKKLILIMALNIEIGGILKGFPLKFLCFLHYNLVLFNKIR